jgi:hypothetical protein
MDKFLDTYNYPKVNQKYINHLNKSDTQLNWSSNKESPPKEKSGTWQILHWILSDL